MKNCRYTRIKGRQAAAAAEAVTAVKAIYFLLSLSLSLSLSRSFVLSFNFINWKKFLSQSRVTSIVDDQSSLVPAFCARKE
jgi:hypothetical protein